MKYKGYRYHYGVYCGMNRFMKYVVPACPHSLLAHMHPLLLWKSLVSILYLGVHISSDLSWSAHNDTVASKARKTLGFIYRKLYRRLYTIYVEPRKVNNASISQ